MATATLVPVSRRQRIALKNAPLTEVTQVLLGYIPEEEGNGDFPELPAPLEATAATRKSFSLLGKVFNKVILTNRRRMSDEELSDLGSEYKSIQDVVKLLLAREEQIKTYVRTHQDVVAEESGMAFPKDVVRGGRVVAEATPRDTKGHYLLASKGNPEVTEVPGTNLKFSNQYTSGRSKEDLDYVNRAFESGEIDEETYKACTRVVRVPDAEKIRAHTLKTGDTSLLARVVRRGRPFASMHLRGLTK